MTTRHEFIRPDGRTVYPSYPPSVSSIVTTPAVRVRIYTTPDVAAVIMTGLLDIVDGGTVYGGRGWWTDTATGVVDTETAATMDIVTTPDTVDTIGIVATTAARVHGESCIMMTVDRTETATIWTDGRTDTETETVDDMATTRRTS